MSFWQRVTQTGRALLAELHAASIESPFKPAAPAEEILVSSNPPVILSAVVRILTDFAVRAFIRSSSATVQAARAQVIISIAQSLEQVDEGDPAGGAAFAAAVASAIGSNASTDPGLADALETLADVLQSKVVSVASALQGTLAGAALATFNSAVLQHAASIAAEYLPVTAAAPPAPVASAASVAQPAIRATTFRGATSRVN